MMCHASAAMTLDVYGGCLTTTSTRLLTASTLLLTDRVRTFGSGARCDAAADQPRKLRWPGLMLSGAGGARTRESGIMKAIRRR